MVSLSGVLLSPLIVVFSSLVILLFAFRKEIEKNHEKDITMESKKDNSDTVQEKILRKMLRWIFLPKRTKDSQKPSVTKLIVGILFGIVIYASLMYGSSLYESTTVFEIYTKIPALYDGAVLYVMLIAFVGIVALYPFFTRRDASFFAGVAVSFAIFEVYFALRCPETIPFIENFGKHFC